MKKWGRVLLLVTFWIVVFLFHLQVYLSALRIYEFDFWYGYVIIAFLSVSFILASRAVKVVQHTATDIFYFITASWLGVVFILFSGTVIYEMIRLVFGTDSEPLFVSMLALSFLVAMYALWQGQRITTKEITIPIKGLTNSIKLVHLTDVHIGTVHQVSFLRRVVQITNDLQPDVVLMTGDLFDGSMPIHKEMLQPLDDIKVPTYFSTGNHEEYEGLEDVKDTIKQLQMKLLDEEVVEFNGVQVLGVRDRSSIPKHVSLDAILGKMQFDRDLPAVLMYHTPVEWDSARKHGIDLMLSGHTHNGQIFPFTLLVRMSFKYIMGLYQKEDKYLHVSPGTGTWGPPMRLGSKNQITLIHLVGK